MELKRLKLSFVILGFIIAPFVLKSLFCFAQTKGGRWAFENNGNDEAVWDNFDNNGSLSGTASFTDAEPKLQGNYFLSLEDSANYGVLTITDQEELDFTNENFAISLWYFPVKGYDNPQHLVMKGDRSGSLKTNNYALRINDEYPEFIVHSESGAIKAAKSSFKAVESEWNFLAVFYNYTTSKLYIWNDAESSPADTLDFNAPLFPNNNNLYIGTSGENGFKRFWGRIDDLRIGNKIPDIIDQTTNISSELKNIHSDFTLSQNYPNPFNPITEINFVLMKKGFTTLNVYNLLGVQVASLINSDLDKGQHEVRFDAGNLASGVYLYRLQQGKRSESRKMILIK